MNRQLHQLTLMLFFAPLFTAAAISYEKDRRTFTLLMMTDLSDLEIVLGKLVAGLLNILTILAASIGLVSLCGVLRRHFASARSSICFWSRPHRAWRAGRRALDRAVARPDLSVDFADDPDGGVFGHRGRSILASCFPASLSWECRWQVLNPYRAMLAVLYPDRRSSRPWCGRRAWSTSGHA